MRYDCYEMARPKCYETAADRQRAYRERKRNAKNLSGGVEQREVASPYVPETKRALVSQAAPPSQTSKEETLDHLRSLIKAEEEKPVTDDSRTVKDVVGGIYRNDHGGVISKMAWEKLQRLKEHAKANNFEMDEYSQGL